MHRVPALFVFSLSSDAMLDFQTSISLEGNVIDLTIVNNQRSILYSMDAIHTPFSTGTIEASEAGKTRPFVGLLESTKLGWKQGTACKMDLIENMEEILKSRPFTPESKLAKGRSMKELLYNLENLRKTESED